MHALPRCGISFFAVGEAPMRRVMILCPSFLVGGDAGDGAYKTMGGNPVALKIQITWGIWRDDVESLQRLAAK